MWEDFATRFFRWDNPMATTAATLTMGGLAALIGACASGGIAPLALAQEADGLSFSVENYTSVNLVEFYLTPSTGDDWGSNYLEDFAIPPRSVSRVVVDDHSEECLYDMLGVFDDGEYAEEYGVDLCAIDGGSYTFYDENDAVFSIQNQSSDAIVAFYFTPENVEDWGENLFAAVTPPFVLEPGGSVEIPVDSSDCTYDLMAVFADGDRLEQEGVDVCAADASIVFTDIP
jgi:hypothetical protein